MLLTKYQETYLITGTAQQSALMIPLKLLYAPKHRQVNEFSKRIELEQTLSISLFLQIYNNRSCWLEEDIKYCSQLYTAMLYLSPIHSIQKHKAP